MSDIVVTPQETPDNIVVAPNETPDNIVVSAGTATNIQVTSGTAPGPIQVNDTHTDHIIAQEDIPNFLRNLFIQPTAPATDLSAYLWIQTEMGPSGADVTFWVEDGA